MNIEKKFLKKWTHFWMRYAGLRRMGRLATWLASLSGLYYKDALELAYCNSGGYIAFSASFPTSDFILGKFVFIDKRVTIFRAKSGGPIILGDKVAILRETILETEQGGTIEIGDSTWIHPKCNLAAAAAAIKIGRNVMIAAGCSFFPHNHSIEPNIPIAKQPLYSRGPIIIGDNAWLGTGVIVLSGVTIGEGAVIGAGAVVTKDIPANAVAFGVPARVLKMR
jgi:acetyltransferase-like isoleucine patch superfamily enzyme